MAKRFCGDVKMNVKFRWSTSTYKVYVVSAHGRRTIYIALADARGTIGALLDGDGLKADSPEAYDAVAELALEKAMDLTGLPEENDASFAISDAAASGLTPAGWRVLRETAYMQWLDEQTSPAPVLAGNSGSRF